MTMHMKAKAELAIIDGYYIIEHRPHHLPKAKWMVQMSGQAGGVRLYRNRMLAEHIGELLQRKTSFDNRVRRVEEDDRKMLEMYGWHDGCALLRTALEHAAADTPLTVGRLGGKRLLITQAGSPLVRKKSRLRRKLRYPATLADFQSK